MALEADGLIQAIETAFASEWARVKQIPLPVAGADDRRLLFAAVARGLLTYLAAHEGDLVRTFTANAGAGDVTWAVSSLDLDIQTAEG
jgi:hypothetical protein